MKQRKCIDHKEIVGQTITGIKFGEGKNINGGSIPYAALEVTTKQGRTFRFSSSWGEATLDELVETEERSRGRVLADEGAIEEIREAVNAAMHDALLQVLDPGFTDKEKWQEAVYQVGYAAEKQARKLLGVKARRRSR